MSVTLCEMESKEKDRNGLVCFNSVQRPGYLASHLHHHHHNHLPLGIFTSRITLFFDTLAGFLSCREGDSCNTYHAYCGKYIYSSLSPIMLMLLPLHNVKGM